MDRERKISNAAVVAMLEEKLPKKIEDDWLEIVTGERADQHLDRYSIRAGGLIGV